MTELVQAWNGKWHIFERDLTKLPAQPVSQYNQVAKPERQIAVTGCGLQVFTKNAMTIRSDRDLYEYWTRVSPSTGLTSAGRRPARPYCQNCLSVLRLQFLCRLDRDRVLRLGVVETRRGLLGLINDT